MSYKRSKTSFWDKVYDINMEVLKPYVLKEPAVDNCYRKMVSTSVAKIFEIDLYTIKKEQLDFSKGYELTFFRNDTFSGLVAWFDIFFDKLPNKIQFSTGIINMKFYNNLIILKVHFLNKLIGNKQFSTSIRISLLIEVYLIIKI